MRLAQNTMKAPNSMPPNRQASRNTGCSHEWSRRNAAGCRNCRDNWPWWREAWRIKSPILRTLGQRRGRTSPANQTPPRRTRDGARKQYTKQHAAHHEPDHTAPIVLSGESRRERHEQLRRDICETEQKSFVYEPQQPIAVDILAARPTDRSAVSSVKSKTKPSSLQHITQRDEEEHADRISDLEFGRRRHPGSRPRTRLSSAPSDRAAADCSRGWRSPRAQKPSSPSGEPRTAPCDLSAACIRPRMGSRRFSNLYSAHTASGGTSAANRERLRSRRQSGGFSFADLFLVPRGLHVRLKLFGLLSHRAP